MTDEILDTPETDPVVPARKSSPADPGQAVDWEARYKGLQRTYDRLMKDNDALKLKYETLLDESETARQEARKTSESSESLKKSIKELEDRKMALEADLANHRAQVDRTKTIMAKYPDLAPFEAQGLLPSAATTEELEQKLENFRKAIHDSVDETALSKLRGYTPPSSANNQPPASQSKESVFAELQRLSGRRTSEQQARYDELISIWDDLNK